MKIKIRYETKLGQEKCLALTSEEYFDSLDKDKSYENDGIPKFA